MPRPAAFAAVLTAAVLPLSACSSGADPKDVSATSSTFTNGAEAPTTAAPNPAAITSPSPGSVISSDKVFNFVVPGGWNLTQKPGAVAYLSSATVAHDVAATIVINRSKVTPAPALDETLQMAMMQARQDGKSVKRLPERTVGGEKAVSFTARSTEKNVALERTYVIVAHEKALYVVVLTSAAADSKANQTTLETLLATLTWTKAGNSGSSASGTTPAALPTSTSTPPKPSTDTPSGKASSSATSKPPSPAASSSKAGSRSPRPSASGSASK